MDEDFNIFRKQLGYKIAFARKEKKLTQERLAEMCNIDVSYVGQIERGIKTPSLKVLYLISKALNMDIKDLLP